MTGCWCCVVRMLLARGVRVHGRLRSFAGAGGLSAPDVQVQFGVDGYEGLEVQPDLDLQIALSCPG